MTDAADLIGAWRLRSFTFTDAAGAVLHPLGERPAGFVLITADGYLALNFMAGERARSVPPSTST